MKKRRVLIGPLSSPNLAIWTAKINRSQTDFRGLLKPAKKEVDKYLAHTDAIKYMHSSSLDIVLLFLFHTLKWLTLLFSRLLYKHTHCAHVRITNITVYSKDYSL